MCGNFSDIECMNAGIACELCSESVCHVGEHLDCVYRYCQVDSVNDVD